MSLVEQEHGMRAGCNIPRNRGKVEVHRIDVAIPVIGPLIASALLAAVGKAETLEHGRDLAACLGRRAYPSF